MPSQGALEEHKKKKKNSLNSYLPQPPKSTPTRVPDFSAAHQFASAAGPSSLSPVGGLKIDPLWVPTDGDAKTIASFFAFVSGQEGQFTPVQLRQANSAPTRIYPRHLSCIAYGNPAGVSSYRAGINQTTCTRKESNCIPLPRRTKRELAKSRFHT